MNPFLDESNNNNELSDPFLNTNNDNNDNNNNDIDPFLDANNDTTKTSELENLLKDEANIELWVVDRGRKCDTYISHLPYTEAELLAHLKILKKKFGCGGSVQNSKDFEVEEICADYFRIHIQGNKKTHIKDYFTQLGIKNIKIKG